MSTQTIRPRADEGSTNFTSTEATDYEAVNEASQDGDSSYLESSLKTSTVRLRYERHGIPDGAVIKSISPVAWAKKIAGGVTTVSISFEVEIGATTYQLGADQEVSSTSYTEETVEVLTNPATAAAWTPEFLRDKDFKLVIVHTGLGLPATVLRLTQTYIDIDYTIPTFTTRRSGGALVG